ncbi:MAG TPA: hypothetical protein VKT78_12450, partial [Fimbriimonadaceae bacterium]|nr:hypothetical protein [Fimbriimonadaceae bacterium]
ALPLVLLGRPDLAYGLLRSLDSIDDPSELVDVLKRMGLDCAPTPGGPLLQSEEMLRACDRRGVFVHFDEVWLYRSATAGEGLPPACFTTDAWEVGDEPPHLMEAAMTHSGCSLVLADGDGLNYATPDSELEELLKRG